MEVVNLYSCVECDEVITNPMSEERLALTFRAWLAEVNPKLEEEFTNEYVKRSDFITEHADVNCVLSGKKMDLCPYCTTNQFITWLHEKNVPSGLLKTALRFFLSLEDEKYVVQGLKIKTTVDVSNEPKQEEHLNELAII